MRYVLGMVMCLLVGVVSVQGLDYPPNDNLNLVDYDFALDEPEDFAENFFPTEDEWALLTLNQRPSVRINIQWESLPLSAIITMDRFIYPSQTSREIFLQSVDEHLATTLAQYDFYEQTATCRDDNVLLYEIDTAVGGFPYIVHVYLWRDGVDVRSIGLYFPRDSRVDLLTYAALFQPDFVSCED
ncbi:MAG: hypothetical protein AAFQ07_03820 [Chloroflexota bacterium]